MRANEALIVRLTRASEERAAPTAPSAVLESATAQLMTLLAEIETVLKGHRAELDAIRDRRAELGATCAKVQADLTHLGENSVNELSLKLDELRADESLVMLESEPLAAADQEQRELRARLDAMGPVNMMALEEYRETSERHQFLETQRKDLLESIENTQNSIKEIDQISR